MKMKPTQALRTVASTKLLASYRRLVVPSTSSTCCWFLLLLLPAMFVATKAGIVLPSPDVARIRMPTIDPNAPTHQGNVRMTEDATSDQEAGSMQA
jgi:hypothetical protein